MTIQQEFYYQFTAESTAAYREYHLYKKSHPDYAQECIDYSVAMQEVAIQIYWMTRAQFSRWYFFYRNELPLPEIIPAGNGLANIALTGDSSEAAITSTEPEALQLSLF